ncbi:MAG: hypothetical protein GF344_15395 [Chitinivibrionales bacterium]|nr:hypothetical protein [Chitinivibrionales bacterium]
MLRLQLPASDQATVTVYGFSGDILYRFTSPLAAKLYWNGKTRMDRPAPVGPFFVVAEITSGNTKKLIRTKGILWR